jgi:hypothetical protein
MGTITTLQNISKFYICYFYNSVTLHSLRTDKVYVSTSTIFILKDYGFLSKGDLCP